MEKVGDESGECHDTKIDIKKPTLEELEIGKRVSLMKDYKKKALLKLKEAPTSLKRPAETQIDNTARKFTEREKHKA